MRKPLLFILLLLGLSIQVFGDEISWTVNGKLPPIGGTVEVSLGNSFKLKFYGSGTTYQHSYIKMQAGSGLTVSSTDKTITKIIFGYSPGRAKNLDFTKVSTGQFSNSVWTGNTSSVTLTAQPTDGKGEFSLSSITITYNSKTSASSKVTFAQSEKTYQLINLYDAGQQATSTTGGTITYKTTNPKVVQVDASTGALHFINSGLANIVGTNTAGASSSYVVKIEAPQATYNVSGNTYTLTGTGKLENKTVNDIAGMTMQFGSDNDVTVVRNTGSGMGATTIDKNGYQHILIESPNQYPTWGTYYKFSPQVDGTLTVKGYFTGTDKVAKLTTTNGTLVGTPIAATTTLATATYTLKAGNDYYLYAEPYNVFCLNSFTYDPSLKFNTRSVVLPAGQNSYTQTAQGPTGISYSAEFLGDTQGTINTSTGAVSFSKRQGGAVIVTAKIGASSTYYVITVPYTAHTWVFNTTTMPMSQLNKVKSWNIEYKVRQYKGQTPIYINVPVMTNGFAFDGTNANRIPATAGLLFTSDVNGFGALAIINGLDDLSLDEQLNLPASKTESVTMLSIKQNTKLTIPALKAGQYVKVRWARYNKNTGDHIKATNLLDLDGKVVSQPFNIGRPAHNYGWAMFTVKANGDVTFTPTDNGWTDIESIQVYAPGTKGTTDMVLKGSVGAFGYLVKDGVVPSKIVSYQYDKNDANNHAQTGIAYLKYSIKDLDGVEATMTEDGKLEVTKGQGMLTVVQKLVTENGYVTDKLESRVAVNRGYQTTINYPYTWDFVGRNEAGRKIPSNETFAAFGQIANGNNPYYWQTHLNGTFGIRAVDATYKLPRHVNGSELAIGDYVIKEARGLRITLAGNNEANNSQVFMGNNGALSIGSTGTQKITLNTLPTNAKIYVHAKKNQNAVLKYGDKPLTAVGGATDVYMIQVGQAGNDTLYVKNIDIFQLAVSVDDKNISKAGVATEARSYAVNYDYAKTFLGKELKAYAVTGVDADNTKVTTKALPRVAANTGVMLQPTQATNEATSWPLFTTDINDNTVSVANNRLVGVVTPPTNNVDQSAVVGGTAYYNYLLANSGYSVHYRKDASTGEVTKEANGLGFYLVLKQGTKLPNNQTYAGGKPKANTAYLQLQQLLTTHTETGATQGAQQHAKQFYQLDLTLPNHSETNGIEHIETEDSNSQDHLTDTDDNHYYTLQGIRVAHPDKGIYIYKGKKIMIR